MGGSYFSRIEAKKPVDKNRGNKHIYLLKHLPYRGFTRRSIRRLMRRSNKRLMHRSNKRLMRRSIRRLMRRSIRRLMRRSTRRLTWLGNENSKRETCKQAQILLILFRNCLETYLLTANFRSWLAAVSHTK